MTGVAGTVALALAACPPVVGASAKRPPRCDARSGTTIAANRTLRVFERTERYHGYLEGVATYACNRKTGRLKSFGDGERGKDGATIPLSALAGSFVSIVFDVSERRSILVWNAENGATRVYNASTPAEIGTGGTAVPRVTALVQTAKGHTAWIAESGALGPGFVVHAGAAKSTENAPTLAAGADIAPESLATAGGLVYWTRAGLARSAPLP
jgi:hypothetical protein